MSAHDWPRPANRDVMHRLMQRLIMQLANNQEIMDDKDLETAPMRAGDLADRLPGEEPSVRRRDFLNVAAVATAGTGASIALWPLIDSLNPSADVLAQATIEVDLRPIETGQRITAIWREQPLFVVHRTSAEIERARADDRSNALIDPETDAARVLDPEWLVVVGVCTHLGCVPLGQGVGDNRGKYGGWFCPCHGSIYDASGRVRKGPAPTNLVVPPYQITQAGVLVVGRES